MDTVLQEILIARKNAVVNDAEKWYTVEEKMIALRDISKIYKMGDNKIHALQNVTLEIYDGEFLALVGPSGSGKSTLMNILGFLDTPDSGSFSLNGNLVSNLNESKKAKIRSSEIGFVFQSFHLLPHLTALENVELPMIYSGVSPSVRKKKAFELLSAVGLSDRINHKSTELSGGQQQRVSIARALANNPGILLADEPTGALDSKSGAEIIALLKQLNRTGKTVIIITHDSTIAQNAGRIISISDGCITT